VIWNHRSYVGPEEKFYTFGAKMFLTLVDHGLAPADYVLDVGCGSLRVGRELIPYLDPNRYHGIEPNEKQLLRGLEDEITEAVVTEKDPAFSTSADFATEDMEEELGLEWPDVFDWVLAIQVFIHCGPDQLRDFLLKMKGRAKQIFITLKIEEESSKVEHAKPPGERRYNHSDFRTTVYSHEHIACILDETGWTVHSQPLSDPVQNSFILHPK